MPDQKNILRKSELKLEISPHTPLPQLEEAVLEFWRTHQVFEKTLERKPDQPTFTFYDGPPFATGLPHYGHILAMTIKDVVTRYKAMQGYWVPRRNGWDTHGLPVEYELEKELGLKGRRDIIEKVGIKAFNEKAREIVLRYSADWLATMERMGRWIDTKDAYRTMDNDYIESVWWVFKQIFQKGLVYEGHRSMPYCPRCGTPLSNFETNLGYQDNVKDPSVFVKFQIKGAQGKKQLEGAHLLAWTTTPWTLPANAALAMNADATYVLATLQDGSKALVEENRAKTLAAGELKGKLELEHKSPKFKGSELVGITYKPLFIELKTDKKAHFVNTADFVSLEEGTGILHVAPAYGQDDFEFGQKHDLPLLRSLNDDGTIVDALPWKGEWFKKADAAILDALHKQGSLISDKHATIRHTYPFCWRCETPLYYVATASWFVAVSKYKERLTQLNKTINWVPKHLRDGRFGRWLADARDWNVSRRRFWGAPLPIWRCDKCAQLECIGSVKELYQKSGKKLQDLHRPQIDAITWKHSDGGTFRRVEEVFDCWFESGSMPYAQWHYPFEHEQTFKERFPADFIAEGLDQTRGWFYTMHVLSTILFDSPSYKNVVVNGLVLASDGRKLSKRLRNYVEPSALFDTLGADALRLFLLTSTTLGEDYRFSDKMVRDTAQNTLRPLWNTLVFYKNFLVTEPNEQPAEHEQALDEWIQSRVAEFSHKLTDAFDRYQLDAGARLIRPLIDDLANWYLRRSRKRTDSQFAETLKSALLDIAGALAPITPFIAEAIHHTLKDQKMPVSVHLEKIPSEPKPQNNELLKQMETVRGAVALGLAQRMSHKLRIRQPLSEAALKGFSIPKHLLPLVRDELNVLSITLQEKGERGVKLNATITPKLRNLGYEREALRALQEHRRLLALTPKDHIKKVTLFVPAAALAHLIKVRSNLEQQAQVTALTITQGEGETFDTKKES